MTEVFGIFEGGGAAGISHVGALKAAEEEGLIFIGVAGASAGAMVAALVAVGYNADEILNPNLPGANILTVNEYSPIDLIGNEQWIELTRAKSQFKTLVKSLYILGISAAKLFASRPTRITSQIISNLGYFNTDGIREAINKIIRAKVCAYVANHGKNPENVPKWIRFQDIDPAEIGEFCRLKIIATDVLNRTPVIFGNSTPNVVVADAVVASMSIPFVFPPVSVRQSSESDPNELIPFELNGSRFVDGGLISNLPLWVFHDEKGMLEREIQSRIPLLAFELNSASDQNADAQHWEEEQSTAIRFLKFSAALTNTGIFGNQKIVEEFIPDLEIISVDSTLTTLQFDCTWQEAREAYAKGYGSARYQLVAKRKEGQLAQRFLTKMANDLRQKITAFRKAGDAKEIGALRACTISPFGSSSFQVTHSFGMDEDADDTLILDNRNTAAPLAFITKEATFLDISEATKDSLFMTKYERALVRHSLKSIISVPVFASDENWEKDSHERETPVAIISVDSDECLRDEFQNSEFRDWLSNQSMIYSNIHEKGKVNKKNNRKMI